MDNCIFCKIVNKEIPAKIIYEDEDIISFLDISQATKGHCLVVLKKHFSDITSTDDDLLAKAIVIAKKIATKQLKNLEGIIGVNIINNTLEGAGQTIMHTHIHVIPRYKDDGLGIVFPNNFGKSSDEQLNSLVKKLKI
ncbi:MAG: HIT family protein [Erysipelotrichales bacterium]|nr:HIT family protein [Erysipelotrichales bacterium]